MIMIYFDNAATSRPKPKEVLDALNYYINEIGTSPGRGSYDLAIQASRMLYQTRKTVASFFGASDPNNVVFTKNSTESINFFINGYLKQGDHVLISPYEHNAVLRPIQTLKNKGCIDYSVLPENAIYSPNMMEPYIKPNTTLLVTTLASNLTGQIVFSSDLAKVAHSQNVRVFVDASQGAGKRLVDMSRDEIDFLAFTGHKDLLALPGVGGLVSKDEIRISPLIQGGTGVFGDSYINPDIYPDSYESGTLNMPAIWSLKTSIQYIVENSEWLSNQENKVLDYILRSLDDCDKVIIYNREAQRVPTFCFNMIGIPSNQVVEKLNENGICVRGGTHCAIKAHETIGTVNTGAVRVSVNSFNTVEEAEIFVQAIKGLV